MNRVELAINEGRCVLVFGARALQDADALGELRRRAGIPATVLGGEAPNPASSLSPDVVSSAFAKEGGVLCLVEADTVDAQGLAALAQMVHAAAHKPRLVVAARAFNPFLLPPPLRLLKFEHDKKKAKEFLQSLPIPTVVAAPAAAAPVVEEPRKKGGAPRALFVGREEELGALRAALDTGGPTVLVGPAGVGRRWLVEKACQGRAERRLPDFVIGRGCEADSLYARIAMLAQERGDKRLVDALKAGEARPKPAELTALAVEVLTAIPDVILVVDHLEYLLRRDGTFHRESRFELLLRALLVGSYSTRVLFISTIRPRFYRETEGAGLRVMELAGLKGRELHEVFDAYRVEDFPREHFGDIANRIHGHPFATRLFAVAVRDSEDREGLLENGRFFQMSDAADADAIRRRLQKAVDGLPEDERRALGALAHFRLPFTVADTEVVGVDRKTRLALLAKGLLDQTPEEAPAEKHFRVHPLVHAVLSHRETSDYGLLEALGELYRARAEKAEGLPKLAWAQEANRFYYEAHRIRNRYRIPFPDDDPILESIRGMVRSKKPRFDLAEQRIHETVKTAPTNTELLLLWAEFLAETRQDPLPAFNRAAELAPTPEVFHQLASFHQQKPSGRTRAAAALEAGAELFPTNARVRRRLAGLLADLGRLDEAAKALDEAMALEPMMPDTYGLLGQIQLLRGPEHYDQAEAALAEARRLDPENGLHMARLGALICERGVDDPARRQLATELLEQAVQADGKNYLAHLYLARLLLASEGDLDRVDWLLKKAAKLDEKAVGPLVERARLAVRRQAWADADQLTEKAIRLDPGSPDAFYVRGEMCAAQGNIFVALSEFQRSMERAPPGTNARRRADEAIATCKALIESGSATELLRQAEADGVPAVAESKSDAARREPGKTTRRRRGKGGKAEAAEAGEVAGASLPDAEPGGRDADGVRERAPDALTARKPDAVDAAEGDDAGATEPVAATEPDDGGELSAGDAGERAPTEHADPLPEGGAGEGDTSGE